jgi:hypothetical protein
VSDGDDEYAIRGGAIDETVWEPWHQYAPEPRCEWMTALRKDDEPAVGSFDRRNEVDSKVLR